MENRPKTSGRPPSERPLHHWRQEDDDPPPGRPQTGRPQTGRPQTRVERPVSRRGVQNESSHESSAGRAVTPARNSMRPPSASVFSGRGSTAGGRLNTMGMTRINTGLPPTAHANSGMMERPVTQQGIAGIRPGTTRGLTRQIQDKRYYEGLVQIKIRELTQEISTITREIDTQNKERATFLHYDDRAKHLASELTDLQGQLADYNIVIDKVTSNIDKESTEQEALDLQRLNDKATEEIEMLFEQRRLKEQQLRRMEEKIDLEQKKEERIVEGMSTEVRSKYEKLINLRNGLEDEITQMQKEIDHLSTEKLNLEEEIALSQVKQEAVKLRVRISEVEEKRNRLQEEQRNKLSPEEEREKLLAKVKQDNMDIVAAEKKIDDVKKQIDQIEMEMEQLDVDMEENHSEKQVKYNELRKREEAIEQFMPTFDQNKAEETDKIRSCEESIVEKLKRLAFAIDNESGVFGIDEIALLDVYSNEENNHQSFLDLCQEHAKLQQAFRKMEGLEKKMKAELEELFEKIRTRESELVVLEDLEGLKMRSQEQYEELTSRKEELKGRLPILERELNSVRREHQSLKQELDKNEIYVQISALEEKYEKLKGGNDDVERFINEGKNRMNYAPLREKAFSLVESYNGFLKENPKSVY
ncbi:intraflagellar transport protein 74 homolog [Fopius arisanus]|uniref:Intraflagellar transport protein 74 homolog n=1 Tax=Fopius arisanus TaxID=64838 RepID=A0A9R1U0K3_9HYME|nr:PREDICTED: intraflagellar transport protein 74 homolog [Fopius arisanus]XP_011303598.1 PREDICTED: intraflagellar transport protein 74 homolog [Fopius arisanus]XP_011303599.1 PREDICTED: intraflagellar transport protein 74 homolog [Fopius arisanus]